MRPTVRLAVLGAALATLSCGDVPTLENGVAYYTPVLLPLPAVAAGDTLRDQFGHPAPLRVLAFSRDSQLVTGLTVTFVPTSIPADVTIDQATGILVARDTLRSVQIVGQLSGQLQTSAATLQIVPEPSTIVRTDVAADTSVPLPAIRPLPVTVTGTYHGATTTVNGIIVRYQVDSLQPRSLALGNAILITAGGAPLRPDSTTAVDTTKTAGNATRTVVVSAGSPVEKVFISASANRLRDGKPLAGSPVQWVVEIRPRASTSRSSP